MNIPGQLRYSKDHEWLRTEGSTAYIGITDFAQNELGDIVFVDITTEGQEVKAHEVFGSVEAVKTVSDLFMPVSGKILEINPAILDNPELLNTDPYGDGWIIKVELTAPEEVQESLTAEAYKELIGL